MSDESSGNQIPDLSDLSDTTIGDFRLLRRLGVGGMAEVYLAEQLSLRRSVAVKILRQSTVSGANSTLLQRFEQEARAAGGLSHPGIVQVMMIGQEDDFHYIVQEYVPGQNLSQSIKRHGPPEFLQGLHWMQNVAAALKAASSAGIVHRDIKPENIMLTRSGEAKVTDFGLAQLNEPTQKMNLTQAGTTMGTPWYMSPEQIQGENLDHRTDQYSFGVTCYHMFAGQPPFPGRNSVSVAVQHLKEEPKPLREHRADLPEGMCQAIHRMMQKDPADRFSSPEEVEEVLARLENAPVNLSVGRTNSLYGWFLSSLPTLKQAVAGILLCLVVGGLVGRRLFLPPRLAVKDDGVKFEPVKSTPQGQFAVAMLQPGNEAAWEAVVEYFPQSEEALWAQLQKGVCYLNKSTPALSSADRAFSELVGKADFYGEERQELRFLALLGKAYVADASGDEEGRDEIFLKQLAPNREMFQREDLVAPAILRDFRDGLRDRFRDLD